MCLHLGRLKPELFISEARAVELLLALICPRFSGKGSCARGAPLAVGHKGRKLVLVWDYGGAGERPGRTPSWESLTSTTAESRIYF